MQLLLLWQKGENSLKVAMAEEMREIDRIAINDFHIQGILLMEQAAMAVVRACLKQLEQDGTGKVLVLAGKGNNGGDAFAVARLLRNKGYQVTILFLGDISKVTGDALIMRNIVQSMGIPISCEWERARDFILDSTLVVDGVFGTGLKGKVKSPFSEVFDLVNAFGNYVISIDIPSGIHGNDGRVLGNAIKAHETVTFALPKRGHLLYPGREYTGQLHVEDISIPQQVLENIDILCDTLTEIEAKEMLPQRKSRSNKGSYGRLFVIAGSENMVGAAAMACKGAYRCGAGVVYACSVKSAVKTLQVLIPSAVEVSLAEREGKLCCLSAQELLPQCKQAKAIVMGCGLGQGEEVAQFIHEIVLKTEVPLVLDADGLNGIANQKEILQQRKAPVIITPHPGEMSRLTGRSIQEILDNMVEVALDFSKEFGVITVLKDAATVIAHPNGKLAINTTGNSAMAKGGSGDVLSGVIGGLLSQGCEPWNAAVLGVYLHGRAGDLAVHNGGRYGLLADELADYIPLAMDL